MANKIQVRRGLKALLPTLSAGEPAYTTDTRELFVGTGSGNVNMGGGQWNMGTAMSGTSSTTGAYSYSGANAKVGDCYLNTSNGNVYACTTAGTGTTAKWTYKGCIKGATGSHAAVDSALSSTSTNPVQNKVIKNVLDGKMGINVHSPIWENPEPAVWTCADDLDIYCSSLGFNSRGYTNINEVTLDLVDLINAKLAPPTTITVGCVDSKHNWLVDIFVPDGDATAKLQAAINALPDFGGKITILEGEYTISGTLTCNKNVIFEGMGRGTVINFNTSNTAIRISEGYDITFKDCELIFNNPSSSAINVGAYIYCMSSHLTFSNCKISVTSVGYDFIGGNMSTGCVKITQCQLSFKLQKFVPCSNVVSNVGDLKISDSEIILINDATTTESVSYGCNVNLIYRGFNVHHVYAEVTNCDITCKGRLSDNGHKSMACISNSEHTLLCNSHITLEDYGSITQGVNISAEKLFYSISNCYIESTSAADVYIDGVNFTGNYYSSSERSSVTYFSPGMIISCCDLTTPTESKIYDNGGCVFVGNRYNHSGSTLTTNVDKMDTAIANNIYTG